MKKGSLLLVVLVALFFGLSGIGQATVLDFNDSSNLGVTLGGAMTWKGIGGGHLYCEQYYDDDFIYFSNPTYVNSFQMNAMPWENYGDGTIGFVDIEAFNANDVSIWKSTVDLTNYQQWSQWFTVSVETGSISKLAFYSPFNTHQNGFWPSVDNMVINESTRVPEPATLLLLGLGLVGLAGAKKKLLK